MNIFFSQKSLSLNYASSIKRKDTYAKEMSSLQKTLHNI